MSGRLPAPRLAVLNSMAGTDIEESIRTQAGLGPADLDLKDAVFGKPVLDLTDGEARRVRALADRHGMAVYCLSTQLFGADVARGEAHFRAELAGAERAAELAGILGAPLVRLLGCQAAGRPRGAALAGFLGGAAPWLVDCYRDAVRLLAGAGVRPAVENEVADCLLATPDDVVAFFDALDAGGAATFTWDVQNMWSTGPAPSLAVYERLRPLIGYVHLKGGVAGPDGRLARRSALREADWPVRPIVAAVVADGVSPVLCLNPSHGAAPPGWDPDRVLADDLRFVREIGEAGR